MTLSETRIQTLELLLAAVSEGILRKAVFSKPTAEGEIKTELSSVMIGNKAMLRKVSYMRDGKAIQKNLSADEIDVLSELIASHGQINIMTTLGDAEFRTSKSGKENLAGAGKILTALKSGVSEDKKAEIQNNDRKKNHILEGNESFLIELGISDRS